jgi:hypothetical protein
MPTNQGAYFVFVCKCKILIANFCYSAQQLSEQLGPFCVDQNIINNNAVPLVIN